MNNKILENGNSYVLSEYFLQFKPIHLRKGEVIFRPDFPSNNIFYVESGYIKIYSLLENGDEKIIMFYKNHDIFPLNKIFKNSPKNFFAETLTSVTVRCVDENEFQQFLNNNPKAMMELINYFSYYIELYSDRIENLGFMQASFKVMSSLLNLADRFGVVCENGIKIEIPINQREIASTLAMTRETVSREFEKLQKEGILFSKNHEIFIKDINRLIQKIGNCCESNWTI